MVSAPNISGTSVRIVVPFLPVRISEKAPTTGFAVMPESPSEPPHFNPTVSLDTLCFVLLSFLQLSASSSTSFMPSPTSSSASWHTRNFTLSSSMSLKYSFKTGILEFSQPKPRTSTPPAFGCLIRSAKTTLVFS